MLDVSEVFDLKISQHYFEVTVCAPGFRDLMQVASLNFNPAIVGPFVFNRVLNLANIAGAGFLEVDGSAAAIGGAVILAHLDVVLAVRHHLARGDVVLALVPVVGPGDSALGVPHPYFS